MNNKASKLETNNSDHEAYIVDDKGNEVRITQEMIDKAASLLENCLTPFACYQA